MFAKLHPTLHYSSLLLLLFLRPCDEQLPVYQEPDHVLDNKFEFEYVLSPTDNSLKIYFFIYNRFDDTFDGVAALRGTVSLTSMRNPAIKKTFEVGPASVISAPGYNRTTGNLTINPGDSIKFLVSWNFITSDNGTDLRTGFFQYYGDPACSMPGPSRCRAYQEEFLVEADVLIYSQTAPERGSVVYPVCFVSRYVIPKLCPTVDIGQCQTAVPASGSTCFPDGFDPILDNSQ